MSLKPEPCPVCRRVGAGCREVRNRMGERTGCYSNQHFFTEDTSQWVTSTPNPFKVWLKTEDRYLELCLAHDIAQATCHAAELRCEAATAALIKARIQPRSTTRFGLWGDKRKPEATDEALRNEDADAHEAHELASAALVKAKMTLHRYIEQARQQFEAEAA